MRLFIALAILFNSAAHAAVNQSTTSQTTANDHQFTLSVEPFYLLIGGLGAKADVSITNKLSAGIQGVYAPSYKRKVEEKDKDATSGSAYKEHYEEANLGLNYMLTGDLGSNGIYISPAVGYYKFGISEYSVFNLSGEISGPQARLTAGYQIINQNIRVLLGGGLRVAQDTEVSIKDSKGNVVLKKDSGTLNGLALDIQFGIMF